MSICLAIVEKSAFSVLPHFQQLQRLVFLIFELIAMFLCQRLQESEMRNHELSETISESTRPILRQMENLQNTYSTRAKTWEALEKSLTARLGKNH